MVEQGGFEPLQALVNAALYILSHRLTLGYPVRATYHHEVKSKH